MTREEVLKSDQLQNLGIKRIAELGVFMGEHATHLIESFPEAQIDLVDIWSGGGNSGDKNGENMVYVDDMEKVYESLKKKFEDKKNVYLHRMDAIKYLNNEDLLDMVYIDDIHDYPNTLKRMEIARGKFDCKVISGHDYSNQFPGVIKAVDEFVGKYQDEYDVIFSSDKLKSFYLILRDS